MTRPDHWDATQYDTGHGFVSRLGGAVLDLLEPRSGERIIDLGCGTGHLTAQIAASGAYVTGIDSSTAMLTRARELFPAIRFVQADAVELTVDAPIDAVFSNAALHWMTQPERVAARVAAALRPGGRFVAEMGGQGNVATIVAALQQSLTEHGLAEADLPKPWFFPSIARYAAILEAAGFEVEVMHLFDRPTRLDDGPDPLGDWIRLLAADFVRAAPTEARDSVVRRAVTLCEPTLHHDGAWWADYRRLRFRAWRD